MERPIIRTRRVIAIVALVLLGMAAGFAIAAYAANQTYNHEAESTIVE
jgi:hypothetical protein